MKEEKKGIMQLILSELAMVIFGLFFFYSFSEIQANPIPLVWAYGIAMIMIFGLWCLGGGTLTPKTL